MVQIDDIMKRSQYINLSNHEQEYNRFHKKSKMLLESKQRKFNDTKFLLKHWEGFNENQLECFKIAIDILDESYDNMNDFNYIKSYIINEIAPTVRDAKQSVRYLKYKTTRMKNNISKKIKNDLEDMKNAATNKVASIKTVKKSDNDQEELREAYVQILNVLDTYNHCDRILENVYTIQKTFNIMNMVESTDINDNYKLITLVDSICECINTYDEDFKTRFNTTLETCFYFLSRKNKNFNKGLVLEEVVNNFISKDFPEYELRDMKTIIDESVVFNNIDKQYVDFIYKNIPFEEASELAKPFLSNENDKIKEFGSIVSNISNDMTDKDVRKIFSGIRPLFTIQGGEVLACCSKDVESLIKKVSSLYSGNDFCKLCADEVSRVSEKRDNKSLNGYRAQAIYIDNLNKYAAKYNKSESVFVTDLELYDEAFSSISKTAKEIVNDFKMAKTKKATDVRTCLSKMFTKSPDQIIDGTPNFLSWIRLSYILGATYINPILGVIALLVDQFIAMKLQRRDTSKMITVFNNERKAVSEKIKKADVNDKNNLKEYDKYLEKGIKKMEEYQDSLLSEYEKELKDFDGNYDKDEELKSITGEDDDDFDFDDFDEATSFEKLFEKSNYLSKQYFTENIKDCISELNEDVIDTITDIACKHPNIISTSTLYTILKEELDDITNNSESKKWVRMSCLNSNIKKLDPDNANYFITNDEPDDVFEIVNGLEDLFVEISINRTLNPTTESVSGTVKMIGNKLKNTMQKAMDIDKETSRKIDSAVNMFISGIQRANTNNNREAIIKGSIIPSASKVIKTAIVDGAVALVNPAVAIIMALGQFALSKKNMKKERQLVLDEIEIELEMCKRYLRQAEDQNDLDAQKRLLRIQRTLERQRQRLKYNMKINWKQNVPDIKEEDD